MWRGKVTSRSLCVLPVIFVRLNTNRPWMGKRLTHGTKVIMSVIPTRAQRQQRLFCYLCQFAMYSYRYEILLNAKQQKRDFHKKQKAVIGVISIIA